MSKDYMVEYEMEMEHVQDKVEVWQFTVLWNKNRSELVAWDSYRDNPPDSLNQLAGRVKAFDFSSYEVAVRFLNDSRVGKLIDALYDGADIRFSGNFIHYIFAPVMDIHWQIMAIYDEYVASQPDY